MIFRSRKFRNELGLIAFLYLLLTVLFLWFAVRPDQLSTRLQDNDSVIMSVVMDHVSRFLFDGRMGFWDLGIFYPTVHTICLSEPMVTAAVLFFPVIHLFNYVVAYNLWIYFCWWSLAVIVWVYLRNLGLGSIAAFWGGLFVSFNCDRLWDVIGHAHLYYQSGLFVALLAMERALVSNGIRWKILFFLGLISQAFAGMYISAICAAWGFFIFPAAAWRATQVAGIPFWKGLANRGKFIPATLMVTGLMYLPILKGYLDFSKTAPQNLLTDLCSSSATMAGYLLPPYTPGHLVTLGGRLSSGRVSPVTNWEDTQFPGFVAIAMTLVGLFILVRRKPGNPRRGAGLGQFMGIAALAGAWCFVLSLGPYAHSIRPFGSRLPFAYLYAWFEPIRFLRAPARFSAGVNWSIALIAAWALDDCINRLRNSAHVRYAHAAGFGCILVTMIQFFPINEIHRTDAVKSDFSEWMISHEDRTPYIQAPTDALDYLVQLGFSHAPAVNGYSGYYPANSREELAFFDFDFPDRNALAILEQKNTRRVFVPVWASETAAAARASSDLHEIWRGKSGTLFETSGKPLSARDISRNQIAKYSKAEDLLRDPLILIHLNEVVTSNPQAGISVSFEQMKLKDNHERRYGDPRPHVQIDFSGSKVLPASYRVLKLKYKLTGWFKTRESGFVMWMSHDSPDPTTRHEIEFLVQEDGKFHEIEIPLDRSIPWISTDPIKTLQVFIGRQLKSGLVVESLRLE